MGSDMQITYVFQDEIPPQKSGKRLYILSELAAASGWDGNDSNSDVPRG
jgi:hypothetical protein